MRQDDKDQNQERGVGLARRRRTAYVAERPDVDVDDVSDRLHAIEQAIQALQGDNSALADALRRIVEVSDPQAVLAPERSNDTLWTCVKCGHKLATNDDVNDVLRIRVREVYIYAHLGDGGWLETTCRHCSERNRVHWVPEAEVPELPDLG